MCVGMYVSGHVYTYVYLSTEMHSTDMCTYMSIHMCIYRCAHMWVWTCTPQWRNVRGIQTNRRNLSWHVSGVDIYMDIYMCAQICADTCVDMCMEYTHVQPCVSTCV